MRLDLIVTLLVLLAVTVSASHTFHTRTSTPRGWTRGHPAAGHEKINFMIALKQRNMDVLERIFWEVCDPLHENYQQFMTPREIMDMIAPDHETKHTVKHWLKQHGATHVKDYGDALEVETTVAIASTLFDTTFHTFQHKDGSQIIRQWGSYSVPLSIKKYVDMVAGISTFPIPHNGYIKSPNDDNQGVIAQTLYNIYQIRDQQTAASNFTSLGVIEFQEEYVSTDFFAYFAQQANISVQTLAPNHIIGMPDEPSAPQQEAQMDIELIATVNIESTPWFWLTSDYAWLYGFAVQFMAAADVPQVISMSWAWWEGDQCNSFTGLTECDQLGVDSEGYVARVNAEFIKIGLRGVSIVVASGDSGAMGRSNVDCSVPELRAAFPASSPYVTAVGATQLNNPVYKLPNPPPICLNFGYPCPSGGTEVAVSFEVAGFASGGGFSRYASQPSYQAAAVKSYFANNVTFPPPSYYNAAGRALPDVAAIGYNTLTFENEVGVLGGTSASSPIFAGIVGLLNEIAVSKTGKPLGFLNPLFYQAAAQAPQVFHDITVGDNICTEQGCLPSCKGFVATKGWDPVTGLGSPNADQLARYLTDLFDTRARKQASQTLTP